jgi:osmoprotectant transport system permease protein
MSAGQSARDDFCLILLTQRRKGAETQRGDKRGVSITDLFAPLRLRVFAFLVLMLAAIPARAQEGVRVRIGSKASNENVVLGELLTMLARRAGAVAEHRAALGGTQFVYQALLKGEIDIYTEYTGTLEKEILQLERVRSPEQLREALTSRGLAMGEPLGFNNTYALGLKESLASKLGLKTISDLAKDEHTGLRLAFSDEFTQRADGWPGLKAEYGLPQGAKTVDHNLAYQGIAADSIDVTDLYSTDAEIRYYNLRILEDDRGYFPAYYCVLLYRTDLAERAPQVLEALRAVEGKIDNETMSEMNARVKIDHVRATQVAADFAQSHLGIAVELPKSRSTLLVTTRAHLFLVGVSLAAAIVVALPLGVWSYKWPKLGHAILGIVGIVQTLPSMAVLCFMIPLMGIGWRPAIVALFLYSLLPIVRGTVAGLREIPGNLKESAIVLGLTPRARLWLIELPMASRSILSGIKTAAVINVGTATIGALIAAGGYGEPILTGLRLFSIPMILEGAVPAAVMALLVQAGFDGLERVVVPRGLRIAAAGKE